MKKKIPQVGGYRRTFNLIFEIHLMLYADGEKLKRFTFPLGMRDNQ